MNTMSDHEKAGWVLIMDHHAKGEAYLKAKPEDEEEAYRQLSEAWEKMRQHYEFAVALA